MKLGVITGFLGRTKDRFHEYNEQKSLEEKFAVLSRIPGYTGVETVFPYEVPTPREYTALLARYKLQTAAINVNVKGEPEFKAGGLTSSDPAIRARALRILKDSKDFAAAVGADKVTCCPLGDGYEFAFQYDYSEAWKYLADAFGQAAAHRPEIPLFIEYKPSETRGRSFVDSAAKTLCLIREAGTRGLGVTIDFGHSVWGGENPAEAFALIRDSGVPAYVHINDNDGKWDWDYFCGTKHYLEYVEFIWYLKRYGYEDFLTSDTSPTRWDVSGVFEANARITNKIEKLIARLDEATLRKGMGGADYLRTWGYIETEIFGLKD